MINSGYRAPQLFDAIMDVARGRWGAAMRYGAEIGQAVAISVTVMTASIVAAPVLVEVGSGLAIQGAYRALWAGQAARVAATRSAYYLASRPDEVGSFVIGYANKDGTLPPLTPGGLAGGFAAGIVSFVRGKP